MMMEMCEPMKSLRILALFLPMAVGRLCTFAASLDGGTLPSIVQSLNGGLPDGSGIWVWRASQYLTG
jgi:hypothetical protein